MPIVVDPVSTPGASVRLRDLWFNRADDPSVFVTLEGVVTERQFKQSEVRVLANGRRRVVTRGGGGRAREYAVTANSAPIAEVNTLGEWASDVLCYRDSNGRKVFGTLHEVSATPWPGHQFAAVTFTFIETTFSEAV